MRYSIAILFAVIGGVMLNLDGDGTFLLLSIPISMALIWSRKDWTKGPYRRRDTA